MRLSHLAQADYVLSKCGRTVPPSDGIAFVDIPASFFYQTVVGTAQTQQQPLEIYGPENAEDSPFILTAISGMQPPAGLDVYVQILFPNGRTLQQALRDWTQDPGAGSSRFITGREVECPNGSKIRIAGSTAFANPQTTCAFSILFEGCYRIYLDKATGQRIPYSELASDFPRVFKTRNQNIFAPRWMTGGFPERGDKYFYASPLTTFALPAAAAGVNNFIEVATDSGYEFLIARRFIRFSIDAGSSATPYIRSRQSDGYMLDDDYVSVAGVTGQFLPKWWRIPPGKSIITDISPVDASGTGNLNIQIWFEGIRRRPE